MVGKMMLFCLNVSGYIKNTEKLNYGKERQYKLTVTAYDCGKKRATEDILVKINIKPTCKASWQGEELCVLRRAFSVGVCVIWAQPIDSNTWSWIEWIRWRYIQGIKLTLFIECSLKDETWQTQGPQMLSKRVSHYRVCHVSSFIGYSIKRVDFIPWMCRHLHFLQIVLAAYQAGT